MISEILCSKVYIHCVVLAVAINYDGPESLTQYDINYLVESRPTILVIHTSAKNS
jgi:hypothetical protein